MPPSKKGFGSKAACALPPDNPDNDIGMKSACVFVRPIGEKMAPDWDRGGCAVEGDGGATSGAASARDGRGFEGEEEWCPDISQTISRILPTAASFSACSATVPSTRPSQSSSAVSWNNLNVSEEQRNILRISSSLKSLSTPSLSRMASTNSAVARVSKRDDPAPTKPTAPFGCTCGGCFCDMIAGKGFEYGSDME